MLNFVKNNKKLVIILILIIITIVILVSQLLKKNQKNEIGNTENIPKYDLEVSDINLQEQNMNLRIIDAFGEVNRQFLEGKNSNSKATIDAYYNETRLNMAMENGSLTFVNLEDIPTTDLNLHDLEGKMITEAPVPTMDGNEVEISPSYLVESGKYYILRAYDYASSYTFYYIVTFDRMGNLSKNWLCFTEGEQEFEYNEYMN